MRKILWLAVLAIPLLVAITLPARVLLPWVDLPDGLSRVQGTVWNGHAQWRQPGKAPLAVNWRIDRTRHWRWQIGNGDTDVRGLWRPGAEGTRLSDVRGRIELDRVDLDAWLLLTRPRGFLELDIERADLPVDRPPEIVGQVIWREARLEGAVHEPLGEIVIDLARNGEQQSIRVASSQPAPVQVRGSIELDAGFYEVDLWLRASGDRPDLTSQLSRLGEMQPDGQVRLRASGALGW